MHVLYKANSQGTIMRQKDFRMELAYSLKHKHCNFEGILDVHIQPHFPDSLVNITYLEDQT